MSCTVIAKRWLLQMRWVKRWRRRGADADRNIHMSSHHLEYRPASEWHCGCFRFKNCSLPGELVSGSVMPMAVLGVFGSTRITSDLWHLWVGFGIPSAMVRCYPQAQQPCTVTPHASRHTTRVTSLAWCRASVPDLMRGDVRLLKLPAFVSVHGSLETIYIFNMPLRDPFFSEGILDKGGQNLNSIVVIFN